MELKTSAITPHSIPELIGLLIRSAPNMIGLVLLILVLNDNYQKAEERRILVTDQLIAMIQCDRQR